MAARRPIGHFPTHPVTLVLGGIFTGEYLLLADRASGLVAEDGDTAAAGEHRAIRRRAEEHADHHFLLLPERMISVPSFGALSIGCHFISTSIGTSVSGSGLIRAAGELGLGG
jgi:hypothetical protein